MSPNLDNILDDLERATRDKFQEMPSDVDMLETYFLPQEDSYVPLANNRAMTMANMYSDFVKEALFPQDGSWLSMALDDAGDLNQVRSAQKLLE